MGENEKEEGLGLSLSLGSSFGVMSQPSFQPNHMHHQIHRSSNAISMHNHHHHLRKNSWNELFQFSERNTDTRSFLRGIDVNRLPTTVDGEEETGVSSPNSTISSISGKRSERELAAGDEVEAEAEAERASCSRESDDEDGGGDGDGDASRKKLRLSKEQSLVLEETFKEHNTLNPKQKLALAKQLNLRPRQVEVWFQNRRARTKLKQTEVDCEYLKRCCENLTDENRRLQKEVQELRALKLSPQLYMHMNPPTTLTMCPQCERVSSSTSTTPSVPPTRHPPPPPPTAAAQLPFPWAVLPIQR